MYSGSVEVHESALILVSRHLKQCQSLCHMIEMKLTWKGSVWPVSHPFRVWVFDHSSESSVQMGSSQMKCVASAPILLKFLVSNSSSFDSLVVDLVVAGVVGIVGSVEEFPSLMMSLLMKVTRQLVMVRFPFAGATIVQLQLL
ncbi:hypothetical protein SLEP1_g21220 [Rubroshorea leprosula]|uniref:Uncharacterized protein n=1 Tax=Rubroshorea leprosula TaxID=152421 RepID=A0AAV5JAL0_9ROSI|nr:hypothetical protein SLEP1_g21220 [Rubroshorea leprosula]